MDYLPEIFATEDGDCDVTNAFCFSKDTLFLVISARSEEKELHGSALIRVKLSEEDPTYEVMHELDSESLDYYAEHADLHYLLASGGYIHRIADGVMTFHDYAAEGFIPNLARLDAETVVVFGEKGMAFRYQNDAYTRMPTGTEETLHAMHFPQPDLGYATGNFGTFLAGDGESFTAIDLAGGEPLRAVHVKNDGSVMLAGAKGAALVVFADELLRIEGHAEDFYSVIEFQGSEYWGDDDYGIYTRSGTAFQPKFNTGYAFNMTATTDLLTINAGYDVYVWDGSDWIRLQINPDMDRLIERVPLDFVPL